MNGTTGTDRSHDEFRKTESAYYQFNKVANLANLSFVMVL